MRAYVRSPNWVPSADAIAELEQVNGQIAALCVAAGSPCAWSIDWYSTTPQTSDFAAWLTLLDADSRRLEHLNRSRDSADRIVASFNLARILALVPRLDSQRQASRFGSQTMARAEQFLRSCDEAAAASIRAAARAFSQEHEASLARCVETERTRWITRPQDRIRLGADGASLYRAAQSELAGAVTNTNEYPLSRLKGEDLLVEMRAAEAYFDAVAAAWTSPQPTAQLAELSQRAERGDFGAWVAAARPDFLGVHAELTHDAARLKVFLNGSAVAQVVHPTDQRR